MLVFKQHTSNVQATFAIIFIYLKEYTLIIQLESIITLFLSVSTADSECNAEKEKFTWKMLNYI